MAAKQGVVDELVVKLTLDASEYEKADKKINKEVEGTEKKAKSVDSARTRRDRDQIKRWKEAGSAAATFGKSLKGLALTVAGIFGVGSAAIGIGMLSALTGFETNLRRTAVSTDLSNRELQAWGSAARRLGADAQAGAQAIADLAKEQKQFRFTGAGPNLQAFASIGVRVGEDTPVQDILGQAQDRYRSAQPAQQKQMEAMLSARGVSPDLILAIKSERDVREAFAKSLEESITENRKSLDAFADAAESLKNNFYALGNTLAGVAEPYVKAFGEALGQGAKKLSTFADKVVSVGGGVDGFIKTLSTQIPGLDKGLKMVTGSFSRLGEIVDILAYAFDVVYKSLTPLGDGFGAITGAVKSAAKGVINAFTSPTGKAASSEAASLLWKGWQDLSKATRKHGPAPVESLLNSSSPAPAATAGIRAPRVTAKAQDLMGRLITQYGLTVPQAAAVVANLEKESSLRSYARNPDGGGQGGLGLAQWRGARVDAFRKRYGVNPNKASVEQQLEFMFSDPYESALLKKSFAAGGSAEMLGTAFSRIYEAHGNVKQDADRGRLAQQLAQQYNSTQSTSSQAINIQNVNVQANNPKEFVGGIQRVSSVQNYAGAMR